MSRPSALILLALAALPSVAGAPPRVWIPEGTRVRVFDIGPKDAWYKQRSNLSDLECVVGPGPLKPAKSTWFRGKVQCDDQREYVFLQVTFESLSTLAPTEEGCPIGAWIGGPLPEGSRVRVLAPSSADAYYGTTDMIGRTATVAYGELYGSGMSPKSCWFGGTLLLDDPSGYTPEYYFYQVAVGLDSKGTGAPVYPYDTGGYGGEAGYPYEEPPCPEGSFLGGTVAHGARVRLDDVHPEDAYYDTRFDLVGRMGTVDGDLHNNSGTCWFGGGVLGDDGVSYYFYKAAVTVLEPGEGAPSCAEGVATAATIPKGNRVKIVDVHTEDAYYGTRFSVIGQIGTTTEQLERMDGCWYAGPIRSDEGQDWYFFKASVVDLGSPQ